MRRDIQGNYNPTIINIQNSESNSEILQLITSIFVGFVFYSITDMFWLTTVGIAVVVYSLVWYLESLGRGSAILQIMFVIASFQWILGPIIAYHYGGTTDKYRMYIPEEDYMVFAVPAVIALLIGLRIISTRLNLNLISSYIRAGNLDSKYIYVLILIGLMTDVAVPYIPASLKFVAYIFSQFKYIGLLYLLISKNQYRWLFIVGIFLLSLITSADHGLFHSLILWSALIFSYICVVVRFSRLQKLLIFCFGFILITALQAVKADYRDLITSGMLEDDAKVSLLIDMILGTTIDLGLGSNNHDIGSLNARLNQGWIISAVMENVPKRVNFVEGETIISAFQDSLIPRFIMDKKAVLVSENFEKYTGITINRNTSMGISILGEAYVNFGIFGGIIFMFFWGIIIALIMKKIVNSSISHPTIILWAPLIFLQMVKAETEMAIVINHGVKTSIAIALFYLTAKKILGWRI